MATVSENPSQDNDLPPPILAGEPTVPPDTQLAVSPEAEIVVVQPPPRIRVGWVAGPQTVDKLVRVLKPLAVGLMDELVEIVALAQADAEIEELPSPPLEVIPYVHPRWLSLAGKNLESLAATIRTRKLGLLHALDATAADITCRLAKLADLPYMVSCYSLPNARRLSLDSHGWAVLAGSEPVRRALLEKRVAPAQKVHLVRPGVYQVDSATCFTDPHLSITIAADGPIDDAELWWPVLKSFAELRARKIDCVLFVIGNGKAERQVRAEAARLGLHNEITFADSQPTTQLAGIVKAADIYIAPVPSQEVDLHALLAMAGGVPVLTAAGPASDFMVADETTLRFGPGQTGELTSKMLKLVNDKAYAVELAERALAYLRKNHSPTGMVATVAQLYRQVILE